MFLNPDGLLDLIDFLHTGFVFFPLPPDSLHRLPLGDSKGLEIALQREVLLLSEEKFLLAQIPLEFLLFVYLRLQKSGVCDDLLDVDCGERVGSLVFDEGVSEVENTLLRLLEVHLQRERFVIVVGHGRHLRAVRVFGELEFGVGLVGALELEGLEEGRVDQRTSSESFRHLDYCN